MFLRVFDNGKPKRRRLSENDTYFAKVAKRLPLVLEWIAAASTSSGISQVRTGSERPFSGSFWTRFGFLKVPKQPKRHQKRPKKVVFDAFRVFADEYQGPTSRGGIEWHPTEWIHSYFSSLPISMVSVFNDLFQ